MFTLFVVLNTNVVQKIVEEYVTSNTKKTIIINTKFEFTKQAKIYRPAHTKTYNIHVRFTSINTQ